MPFALFYDLLRIESESGSTMSKVISSVNPLSEHGIDMLKSDGFQLDELLFVWGLNCALHV